MTWCNVIAWWHGDIYIYKWNNHTETSTPHSTLESDSLRLTPITALQPIPLSGQTNYCRSISPLQLNSQPWGNWYPCEKGQQAINLLPEDTYRISNVSTQLVAMVPQLPSNLYNSSHLQQEQHRPQLLERVKRQQLNTPTQQEQQRPAGRWMGHLPKTHGRIWELWQTMAKLCQWLWQAPAWALAGSGEDTLSHCLQGEGRALRWHVRLWRSEEVREVKLLSCEGEQCQLQAACQWVFRDSWRYVVYLEFTL